MGGKKEARKWGEWSNRQGVRMEGWVVVKNEREETCRHQRNAIKIRMCASPLFIPIVVCMIPFLPDLGDATRGRAAERQKTEREQHLINDGLDSLPWRKGCPQTWCYVTTARAEFKVVKPM